MACFGKILSNSCRQKGSNFSLNGLKSPSLVALTTTSYLFFRRRR